MTKSQVRESYDELQKLMPLSGYYENAQEEFLQRILDKYQAVMFYEYYIKRTDTFRIYLKLQNDESLDIVKYFSQLWNCSKRMVKEILQDKDVIRAKIKLEIKNCEELFKTHYNQVKDINSNITLYLLRYSFVIPDRINTALSKYNFNISRIQRIVKELHYLNSQKQDKVKKKNNHNTAFTEFFKNLDKSMNVPGIGEAFYSYFIYRQDLPKLYCREKFLGHCQNSTLLVNNLNIAVKKLYEYYNSIVKYIKSLEDEYMGTEARQEVLDTYNNLFKIPNALYAEFLFISRPNNDLIDGDEELFKLFFIQGYSLKNISVQLGMKPLDLIHRLQVIETHIYNVFEYEEQEFIERYGWLGVRNMKQYWRLMDDVISTIPNCPNPMLTLYELIYTTTNQRHRTFFLEYRCTYAWELLVLGPERLCAIRDIGKKSFDLIVTQLMRTGFLESPWKYHPKVPNMKYSI